MITVNRDYTNTPEILLGKNCLNKIQQLLLEKNSHRFSEHYYRHDTVLKRLKELYFNKCAYCESDFCATGSTRIDHYRPKDKIKNESHTGYYWLGYEWSNLLPVCEACNLAKSNQFPILGIRVHSIQSDKSEFVVKSPSFLAEQPLIVNPELDKPERHFAFKPDGSIWGITEQGKRTIEVCQLNRPNLVLERKRRVYNFKNKLNQVLLDLAEGKINIKTFQYTLDSIFKEVLTLSSPNVAYSRLGWFMFKFFDHFFIEPLGAKSQRIVRKALVRFLSK